MKIMISFILFFIMYFLSNLILLLTYTIVHCVVINIFAQVPIFLYHFGQPFFWYYYGAAYQNGCLGVLRKVRCAGDQQSLIAMNVFDKVDDVLWGRKREKYIVLHACFDRTWKLKQEHYELVTRLG
jgi:hypothetical protein